MCSILPSVADRALDYYYKDFDSRFPKVTGWISHQGEVQLEAPKDSVKLELNSAMLIFGRKAVKLAAAFTVSYKPCPGFIGGKELSIKATEVILEGTTHEPITMVFTNNLSIESTALKIKNVVMYCLPELRYSLQVPKVEIENLIIRKVNLHGPIVESEELAVCNSKEDIEDAIRKLECQATLERLEMEKAPAPMNLRSLLA